MTFYILLFLTFYIGGIFFYIKDIRLSLRAVLIPISIVAYFVACRVNVGSDWQGYVDFYNYGLNTDGRDTNEIEPLFRLSRVLFYAIGLSYQGFLFVFSILSMFSICYIAKLFRLDNYMLVFLVYVSLHFCFLQLNVVRTGIMVSCVWLAFAYKEDSLFKSFVWILIGVGFHFLALIYIPLLFIIDKRMSRKTFIILIFLSFFVVTFKLGTIFIENIPLLSELGRASMYLDPDSSKRQQEYGITIGLLLNILLCLYARFKYNEDYVTNEKVSILVNVMLYTILLVCILNSFPILVERGGRTLNLVTCFFWPFLLSKVKRPFRWYWLVPFTVYLVLYYGKSLDAGDERMLIPFRYEISSFLR